MREGHIPALEERSKIKTMRERRIILNLRLFSSDKMEVSEAVKRRRALRAFDIRPILEENLEALIEAMRLAPSCSNNQPWRVTLVTAEERLMHVKEALTPKNAWATRAPLIMAISSKPADDCRSNDGRDYYLFDCGIAVGEMILRATELGIIAHCIGGFDPMKVKQALDIPKDYVVITLMICAYPGTDESFLTDKQKREQAERPERKPIGENFYRDVWDQPFG